MRDIEMYIGWTDGRWVNEFVEIPSDTPEDQIPSVAEAVLLSELEKNHSGDVAFVGVYHIPEVEEEDE